MIKNILCILLLIYTVSGFSQSKDTITRQTKDRVWDLKNHRLKFTPGLIAPPPYTWASRPTGATGDMIWITDSMYLAMKTDTGWMMLKPDGAGTVVSGVSTVNSRTGAVTIQQSDISGFGFTKDGNAFGQTGVLGLTDNFGLNILTNNATRIGIAAGGTVSIPGQINAGTTGSNAAISLRRSSDGVEVGVLGVSTNPFLNTISGIFAIQSAGSTKLNIGSNGVFLGGNTTPSANAHFAPGNTTIRQTFWEDGNLLTTKVAGVLTRKADSLFWGVSGPAEVRLTMNDAAFTSARIPFVNSEGRLTDDANLLWSSSELRVGGASDQGSYSIQNTGGLYQNGQFHLRGSLFSSTPVWITGKAADSSMVNVSAIPVSMGGMPTGGIVGYGLRKASGADYDYEWAAVTATGDLTATPVKLGVHIVSDADYSVATNDCIIIFSNLSAARTLTLPSASTNANRILKIRNGGAGAFSINLSASVRENTSVTSSSIAQSTGITIISDGTQWWLVGNL